MFAVIQTAPGPCSQSIFARRGYRRIGAAALLAATVLLGACGGGGDVGGGGGGGSSANISIGVTVGGQPTGDLLVAEGGAVDLAVRAGDSVILEVAEPVFWTLYVGGAAVSPGVEVFYAGVYITATELDAYAVAVDTFADFALRSPVPVTLVATSSFDSALIARVNILITN